LNRFLGRVQQIKELLADDSFKTALVKSSDEPVIVAGDFNTPSHLDWTTSTKDMHCGWQYDWPTTKLLTDEASMIDSFRAVHPDPKLEPGNILC
jgi:endonuclease/exonuclease/phosphatase family metal-dependent hydrolase